MSFFNYPLWPVVRPGLKFVPPPLLARGKLLGFDQNVSSFSKEIQRKAKGKPFVVFKVRPPLKFVPPPLSPAAKGGRTTGERG